MSITYFLTEESAGLSTKSINIIMRQDDPAVEFRRCSLLVTNDVDADDFVRNTIQESWAKGQPLPEAEYMRLKYMSLRTYYLGILHALAKTRANGGTLDTIIAAGLEAVAQNGMGQAEFKGWQLLHTPVTGNLLLLHEIRLFALEGLIAAI